MVELGQIQVGSSLGQTDVSIWRLGLIKDPSLRVVGVRTLGLETTADHLLDLHDNKDEDHHEDGDAPLDSVHGTHAEDDTVKTGAVGDEDLKDGDDGNGVPGELVALEDAGMEGGVVGETSGQSDGDGTEIEGVDGLGTELTDVGGGNILVSHRLGLVSLGPEDGTDDGKSKSGGGHGNTEEEVTADETLANLAGGLVHDAILGGLDGTDETKSDGADQVRVENLDGSQRSVGKTTDDTEKDGHTLSVVDGGVDEENLTKVVPDDTALTDGGNNGGEVVVGQNHLRSLTGNIGTLLTHGNTHVGGLEGGGVVDTVTGHGGNLSLGLEGLDNADLVLRRGTGEDVVGHDGLLELIVGHGIHLGTGDGLGVLLVDEAEHVTDGGGGILVITGDHGNTNTGTLGLGDGLHALGTGRVHDGAETDHGEPGLITAVDELGSETLVLGDLTLGDGTTGKGNDAETMGREGSNLLGPVLLIDILNILGLERTALGLLVAHLEHAVGSTLGMDNELAVVAIAVNVGGGLVDGSHELFGNDK